MGLLWVPKDRKKVVSGQLRKHLGIVFHELASHKERKIHEGHMKSDHLHMQISILAKYAVSKVVGYIKGKIAIYIARRYIGKQKDFTGLHFWVKGFYVSTAGQNKDVIRKYIKNNEKKTNSVDYFNPIFGPYSLKTSGNLLLKYKIRNAAGFSKVIRQSQEGTFYNDDEEQHGCMG